MNRRKLLKITGTIFAGSIVAKGFSATEAITTLSESTSTNKNPLYLHFNENSLGMSPKAKEQLLENINNVNRYPDDLNTLLKNALAEHTNTFPSQITLGSGSSDIIRGTINLLSAKALKEKLKIQLITPTPSFSLAAEYAAGQGIIVNEVTLNNTFEMDIKSMRKASEQFDGISICYLCNPNNPTGTLTPSESITDWIENADPKKTFFIIDEAYFEYITDPDYINGLTYLKENVENVIVLRTFSKIYAMAGMRVGYGVANTILSEELANYVTIFNITTLASVTALASLKDTEFFKKSIVTNKDSLAITTQALNDLNIEYLPTQGNFIFHKINGNPDEYIAHMKEAGIIVGRPFPPLTNWSRVTLGLPQEMEFFAKTLKQFRTKNWI